MSNPSSKLHLVTAVAVIRRNDGRILLLKRSQHEAVYPGSFTFPGGKVESNETITEALTKEVQEECGLTLNPGIILIKEKAIGRPDGTTSKSLSFLCSVDNDSEITLDKKDFTDFKWVNLEELKELEHVGIEAEFIKTEQIMATGYGLEPLYIDTDKVDFRSSGKAER